MRPARWTVTAAAVGAAAGTAYAVQRMATRRWQVGEHELIAAGRTLPPDLEHHFVPVDDGGRIHAVERGSGPPIVLVHGITLGVGDVGPPAPPAGRPPPGDRRQPARPRPVAGRRRRLHVRAAGRRPARGSPGPRRQRRAARRPLDGGDGQPAPGRAPARRAGAGTSAASSSCPRPPGRSCPARPVAFVGAALAGGRGPGPRPGRAPRPRPLPLRRPRALDRPGRRSARRRPRPTSS